MLKSGNFCRLGTLAILMLAMSLLPACEGLQDPMKDRETGDDINLLIVDFNFFKTHITVNVMDAASNQRVEVPVTLTFSGKNGDDIVTYSGNKKPFFEVLNGRMELTVDPGAVPTPNDPVTFGVKAEANGYQTATVTETYLSEGNKVVDIFLSKETDGTDDQVGGDVEIVDGDTSIVFGIARNYALKSVSVESPAWKIQYSMYLAGLPEIKGYGRKPAFYLLVSNFWKPIMPIRKVSCIWRLPPTITIHREPMYWSKTGQLRRSSFRCWRPVPLPVWWWVVSGSASSTVP